MAVSTVFPPCEVWHSDSVTSHGTSLVLSAGSFPHLLQSSVVVRLQPVWSCRPRIKGGCSTTPTSLSWSWTGSTGSSRRTIPGGECSGARWEIHIRSVYIILIIFSSVCLLLSTRISQARFHWFIRGFYIKKLLETETQILVKVSKVWRLKWIQWNLGPVSTSVTTYSGESLYNCQSGGNVLIYNLSYTSYQRPKTDRMVINDFRSDFNKNYQAVCSIICIMYMTGNYNLVQDTRHWW